MTRTAGPRHVQTTANSLLSLGPMVTNSILCVTRGRHREDRATIEEVVRQTDEVDTTRLQDGGALGFRPFEFHRIKMYSRLWVQSSKRWHCR